MTDKKSERLEIRLSHARKQAFIKACDENGITSSEAIRLFIDAYIAQSRWKRIKNITKEMTMIVKRNPAKTATTALASLIFGLVALTGPSIADEKAFKKYDQDDNGRITHEELSNTHSGSEILVLMDSDESGDLTLNEFAKTIRVHTVSDRIVSGINRPSKRVIEVVAAEYDFSEGDLSYTTSASSEFIALDASDEAVQDLVMKLKAGNKKFISTQAQGFFDSAQP